MTRVNSDKLVTQMQPFLKFATDRYPNIDTSKALDSLKRDMENLRLRTHTLDSLEKLRKTAKEAADKIKTMPPSMKALLKMYPGGKIAIGIKFLNEVPVTWSYSYQIFQNGDPSHLCVIRITVGYKSIYYTPSLPSLLGNTSTDYDVDFNNNTIKERNK